MIFNDTFIWLPNVRPFESLIDKPLCDMCWDCKDQTRGFNVVKKNRGLDYHTKHTSYEVTIKRLNASPETVTRRRYRCHFNTIFYINQNVPDDVASGVIVYDHKDFIAKVKDDNQRSQWIAEGMDQVVYKCENLWSQEIHGINFSHRMTDELYDWIRNSKQSGTKQQTIADITGLSLSTIKRIIRE